MKQSTFSAQVANNLLNVLQGYTKGIRLVIVLTMLLVVGIGQAWGQYTKASSIAVGDVVVLVYESGKKELSSISGYGVGTSYSGTPAGLYELTVEAGSSTGTFSLKNGNTYLSWSSGNSLATATSKNSNSSWKITFSNGNATIQNAEDNARKLQWNASSPRFACYTSSQTAVQLYKKSASYTVTFNAGSGSCSTSSLKESTAGAGVTLPTATICDGWKFAGWATSSVASETTTAPELLPEASTYKPTSNITLYAVYKRTEESAGGGSTEEEVTFSNQGYTNQQEVSSYDGTNFSVAFNKGSNSNTPKYYTSGTAIRIYGGGYFTVSSDATITKIVLGFGSSDGSNAITTNVDTYSNGTWTGSANSVEFTIGGTSGNRRIASLTVTTSGGGSTTYYHSTPDCGTPTPTKLGTPTGLTATDITTTTATLSWNTVTNASNYTVTINNKTFTTGSISCNVDNLQPGTKYDWTVTAVGDGTNYTNSDAASSNFTTLAQTYTVTIVKNIQNGSVTASHTTASEGTTITLTPSPASGYKFSAWDVKDASSNVVTVTNNKFTMPASNVTVSATFAAIPQLATPTNLSASDITTTSATLTWEWSDNKNSQYLNGYNLYYKKVGDANFTGPMTCNSNSSTRTGLTPNTEYVFKVAATSNDINECKHSEQSAEFNFKTKDLTQLATPTNLQVTNISCNEVTLSWDAVTNKSSYTVAYRDSKYTNTKTKIYANTTTVPVAPGTTYDWTVQAIGNGTTYADSQIANGNSFTTSYKITYDVNSGSWTACADGCVAGGEDFTICSTVPTKTGYDFMGWSITNDETAEYQAGETINNVSANTTLYAVWKLKTYTIKWVANGQEVHKQEDATHGTDLAVPSAPETYACDDKVFVGWTATPIDGSTDTEPADLFTTKTAKVEDAATTYYAVFATADAGGSTTDTYDWESDQTGNWTVDAAITRTQSQGVDESYAGKINTNNTYVTYNNKVAVTNFAFDFKRTSNNTNYKVYIETSTDKSTWTSAASYEMSSFGNGSYTSKSQTFDGTKELYVRFYCSNTTAVRYVDNVSITYGGTSYSEYVTSCAVIPDPVWGGAVIDNATIAVNCGETSPMNSAATISFPAATNNTLTYDITVTASNGFLVSTNKTDNTKYGETVTLSPVKTGANAGTFTSNVYVRAVAPAMSDVDFTGTITISGKQIATQTINVTADVTCTGYTLTLVDRGVSTLQPETYFAGQTIDEAPTDPEGVCTDPIHYVFDGWAAETVVTDATTYTPVSFPYTVTGNTKFYAVYRYTGDGGEPSNDFIKVTSAKDDWTGDYVIVNEDAEKAIGNAYQNTNTLKAHDVTISDNKVVSPSNDIIWQIRKNGEYYTMYNTAAEKYAYVEKADAKGAGLSTTAQNMQIIFNDGTAKVSGVDIYRCFYYYGTNTEWRTYATGSYNTGALYCRSLETYLYTTSPICGPHMEITAGEDIYVTGGYKNGTRDLVIAQQQVEFKATRLNTSNGKSDGTAPDVKVASNGITVGGQTTTDVKVVIEQNKEQQLDGTYTITGTITVQYQPSAANKQEDVNVQLVVDYPTYNADATANFTVHARSLPSEFVIVAKSGDKWYALNADMSSSKAQPANGQVTLNDLNNPTEATFAPCNAIYTFEAMPQGAEDRISVRFIGKDNKYLWAASGTNTGIQNNSTNPAADALAYNWKLYTEDNITYRFGNANSSRLLGLSSEKFGMYASAVQELRILPYVEKCLYNYAPSNLTVKELKGSYVVLTWDAVAGATKYQYSTDGTTWTDCGTEPTATITGLTGDTEYIYYIRAYHEDAGVSQECIDYAEITFTTADCDDVPTDISFAAGIYSITLYWQCAAETSTVILYSDEAGTQAIKTITDAKSPLTIDDLDKVTTYYAKILAGGTCASPLTTVSTAPPAVDVVEWKTNGMDVYVNTDDEIIVSLEGEVYEGSGSGNVATELFFSKYFEATGNVKLLALFNGTGQDIDLSTYSIKFSAKGADYTGATTTEEVKYDNTIELSEDIPDDRLILPAGKELIMISYPTSGADGAVSITNPDGTTIKIDSKDAAILECAANNSQESGWDDYVRVTSPLLNFSGNDAVALFKGDQLVDIIGAGNTTNVNMSAVVAASTNSSFMDAAGWYNANGYQIQPDGTIGTTNNYPLSTNRCLLIRRNTVINGDNAVLKNTTDFVTLGGQYSEWMGYQIPDGNGACEGFAYVGKYDYANYYTTYDKVGEDQIFESGSRNPDGTVPVSIQEIGKYSCKNLKITVKDEEQVLVVQEFKVPIIVAKNQNTDGEVFTALKTTLGTVVIDQNGTPTGEIEPLTDEEWIEECKECDIVVRDNATLTHVKTGLDQFRDLTIYPTGKLSNIESNLAVNRLMIQAENNQVGYAIIEKDRGSITANAIAHTKRIDAQYWYAFSLPYDCNINEITQANGESMGEYGVHWGIQYYDGERRQREGTSANLGQSSKFWLPMGPNDKLNAYQGYLIALFDASVQKPTDMRTIYFPPAEENTYTESGSDSKQTNVYSWDVNLTCEKRHHGWNFTGTPYISMFNPVAAGITDADLSNVLMTGTWDPVENEYEENEHVYVSIPTPNGGKYYNQHLASTKELLPFMAYFVQTSDPTTGDETKQLTYAKGGRELPAAAPARAAATAQRVLVELLVTAPDGQTDNTGVWVDENYVSEYELAADLTKMYVAGEKPQLYTLAANNEKMAYNALPDGAATNIPLGLYAPIAGDYNLSLNERMSRIAGAESVELIYNNAVVANLLFQDYTITANKGNVNGYSLCIRRRANVTTAVDNVTGSVITMIVNDGYISVLGVPTDATVYVYDMVGHLMEMQSANGNTVVNMPSVPQGVYNIVITNDKGSTTIKSFVK